MDDLVRSVDQRLDTASLNENVLSIGEINKLTERIARKRRPRPTAIGG
jgi:hypothetical protein